jgi:hypothetical protein
VHFEWMIVAVSLVLLTQEYFKNKKEAVGAAFALVLITGSFFLVQEQWFLLAATALFLPFVLYLKKEDQFKNSSLMQQRLISFSTITVFCAFAIFGTAISNLLPEVSFLAILLVISASEIRLGEKEETRLPDSISYLFIFSLFLTLDSTKWQFTNELLLVAVAATTILGNFTLATLVMACWMVTIDASLKSLIPILLLSLAGGKKTSPAGLVLIALGFLFLSETDLTETHYFYLAANLFFVGRMFDASSILGSMNKIEKFILTVISLATGYWIFEKSQVRLPEQNNWILSSITILTFVILGAVNFKFSNVLRFGIKKISWQSIVSQLFEAKDSTPSKAEAVFLEQPQLRKKLEKMVFETNEELVWWLPISAIILWGFLWPYI